MVVDNAVGTLRVTGDGTATASAILQGAFGMTSAKVIVLSFTLADRAYAYSLTGQLSANRFAGTSNSAATARLAAGDTTVFEVIADSSPVVTLSETGTLPPGSYTLSIDTAAAVLGGMGTASGCDSSANFFFALDSAPQPPTPTTTPAPTPPGTPTPTSTPTPGGVPQAVNLSTRLLAGTGNNVGIGGFIITGSAPQQVLLRGIGPSLGAVGVANSLADPVLELHGTGAFATITNNNWRETQEAEIVATGIAPTNDLESAILITLDPGAYTAILRGNGDTAGVGLVEIYGLGASASKLGNISTRAFVSTGGDIVIAGFILGGGTSNARIAIRGLGPSLGDLGLSPVLADPTLELRNSSGVLVRSNNDWRDDPTGTVAALGLAPTDPLESAIAATLPPGAYTALLSGVNNGNGLGLVEVYDLGSP